MNLYSILNVDDGSLNSFIIGEQSVGKSFALNHLVDTSFAGSAMRTTGEHYKVATVEATANKCQFHVCRGRMDGFDTYG